MNISQTSQKTSPQPQQYNQSNASNVSTVEKGIALVIAVAVIVTLIILVLYPRTLDSQSMTIVRFIAAVFAGIAGYLFSGTLDLSANIP